MNLPVLIRQPVSEFVLLIAVCRVLDKKIDAAFCAASVFEGVSDGMNVGRLNRPN